MSGKIYIIKNTGECTEVKNIPNLVCNFTDRGGIVIIHEPIKIRKGCQIDLDGGFVTIGSHCDIRSLYCNIGSNILSLGKNIYIGHMNIYSHREKCNVIIVKRQQAFVLQI